MPAVLLLLRESGALGAGRPQLASVCRRHRERTACTDRRRSVVLLLYSIGALGAVVADAPSALITPRSAAGQAQMRLGKPLRNATGQAPTLSGAQDRRKSTPNTVAAGQPTGTAADSDFPCTWLGGPSWQEEGPHCQVSHALHVKRRSKKRKRTETELLFCAR